MTFPTMTDINYLLVFDESITDEFHFMTNSIFQGFANGLINMDWAFRLVIDLPADVYDYGLSREVRIRRRMTGDAWRWMVLYQSEIAEFDPPDDEGFWVIITGDDKGASSVLDWRIHRRLPVLHISTSRIDPHSIDANEVGWQDIRDFIRNCGRAINAVDASYPLNSLEETLAQWREPEPLPIDLNAKPHNCTLPNLLTLKCFGAKFRSESKLVPGPNNEN